MLRLTFKRKALLFTGLVLLVAATAFAILASVAASHSQFVPDDDGVCVVCTAFDDSLHKAHLPQEAAVVVAHLVVAALPQSQRLDITPTLLPPSCGPPVVT